MNMGSSQRVSSPSSTPTDQTSRVILNIDDEQQSIMNQYEMNRGRVPAAARPRPVVNDENPPEHMINFNIPPTLISFPIFIRECLLVLGHVQAMRGFPSMHLVWRMGDPPDFKHKQDLFAAAAQILFNRIFAIRDDAQKGA